MYLLATSLSAIYATFDYAFTIRIDFTSTTAGLASLASYVQLTKPRFFFSITFPQTFVLLYKDTFIIHYIWLLFYLIISLGSSSPGRFFQLRLWNFNATELSDFRQSARM